MLKKFFLIQTIVFICLDNIVQTVKVCKTKKKNVDKWFPSNPEKQNLNADSSSHSYILENESNVIDRLDDTTNEQNSGKQYEENEHCGLKNLGLTCYANSLLQSLFHIKRFRDKINEFEKGEMMLSLKKLFQEMQKNKIYEPKDLLDHIIKDFYTFEDINEFHLQFFDKLMENKEEATKISELDNLITGTTKETTKNEEGESIERRDDFKNIFLPTSKIDGTFIDNLEESLAQEFSKDGTVKKEIEKAPEILFLLINRFVCKENYTIEKYDGLFKFSKEIDISPYCVDKTIENTYKLHSVIVHLGYSTWGHYFCNILIDGKWYLFNDDKMGVIEENDAIEEQFGCSTENPNEMKKYSAYYLVYVKKN
ncbi:ubiquitin carboxyl-terminal hydrolase [Vairimorpha necatrix]|uniref:Ubiquitin carboxyl-terminal hydrolase n=1 Tax=Vairimorpha necatrix TaxID=6039 RepID=A0AAX4JE12_9MICR